MTINFLIIKSILGDEERGGHEEDKPNFTLFLRELREAINEEDLTEASKKLVLSAAVSAGKKRINQGYEIENVCKEVDFINLMTVYKFIFLIFLENNLLTY